MDLNSVCLTGNLTRDPDLRSTPNGQTVCSFRIACNGLREDRTVYTDVTTWGRQAENVAQYTRKGSRVAIKGRLEPVRTYERRDGGTGATLEVTAHEVVFLSRDVDRGQAQAPTRAATPPAQPARPDDADIPF